MDLGVWDEKVAEELPQQGHLPLGIPSGRHGCAREQPWLGAWGEMWEAQSLLDMGVGALGT